MDLSIINDADMSNDAKIIVQKLLSIIQALKKENSALRRHVESLSRRDSPSEEEEDIMDGDESPANSENEDASTTQQAPLNRKAIHEIQGISI